MKRRPTSAEAILLLETALGLFATVTTGAPRRIALAAAVIIAGASLWWLLGTSPIARGWIRHVVRSIRRRRRDRWRVWVQQERDGSLSIALEWPPSTGPMAAIEAFADTPVACDVELGERSWQPRSIEDYRMGFSFRFPQQVENGPRIPLPPGRYKVGWSRADGQRFQGGRRRPRATRFVRIAEGGWVGRSRIERLTQRWRVRAEYFRHLGEDDRVRYPG